MVRFLRRRYPSANTILLDAGVLVDPGAGWDVAALRAWMGPQPASLVVNTHWHSDHTGANAAFQEAGVPIAAEASEAARINADDPDAGRAWWLQQWIEAYRVDRALTAGDVVEAGQERWEVVALPGHSPTQLGFWEPAGRVLISADALMDGDIGWLDLDADPAALDQAEATIEVIAGLGARVALPGHGPAIEDVSAALAGARRRLASWRAEPERIAWHACKRIFTHALMTEGGMARAALMPMLLACPWLLDHARRAFAVAPEVLAERLVAEVVRSGIAGWSNDRLVALGEHATVPPRPVQFSRDRRLSISERARTALSPSGTSSSTRA